MINLQYAPILIPTLNRYEHFKRCVESLSKCTHADKTDLFIALDYPLEEKHWEGYNKINKYIKNINGFKSVNIIKRNINYGASKNIRELKNYVYTKYDRFIFTEDDNEFSPNFLDYINKGLCQFEEVPEIVGITGYNYPIKIKKQITGNYYLHHQMSAWGYGGWRKKIIISQYSKKQINTIISNKKYLLKLKKLDNNFIERVKSRLKNNDIIYGDTACVIFNTINNKYFIFPVISKVRNHGHDGTGVHCGRIESLNKFNTQEIDSDYKFKKFNKVNNKEYTIIIKLVKDYFNISLPKLLKLKIKNGLIK